MFDIPKNKSLNAIEFKPILELIGILLSLLAGLMLLPFIADVVSGNKDWQSFLVSGAFIAFIGISLILSNRGDISSMTNKQACIFTTLAWLVIPGFGALPFMLTYPEMSYTDAFFEAMSGITSCGATVLSKLDTAPAGILLWRSLLNWVGGIGIIVVAMAILPVLKIGGMQLFKTESSDKSEKILPRATQLATATVGIYVFITAVSAFSLWTAGMSPFDAMCHAMAAMATGGFANYDTNIAHFNDVFIEIILTLTMIVSCLPFVLYIQMAQGRYTALWRDNQVRIFLSVLALSIVSMAIWLTVKQGMSFLDGMRFASFNATSIMTTTGFSSGNYAIWGSYPVFLLFLLSFVGGCTGSTAGGVKIFRFQILYETLKVNINHIIHPHGVFRPQFNKRPVPESATNSVLVFFFVYMGFFMLFTLMVSADGVDFVTAASAVASSMAAAGYGLGNIINPAGSYAPLPDFTKWVLSLAMMMGRLEFLTVLVLFSPAFWRD
jgi:trk system potassium uptake protein